jgi:hypothetical protein
MEDKFYEFMENFEEEIEFTNWVNDNILQEPGRKV